MEPKESSDLPGRVEALERRYRRWMWADLIGAATAIVALVVGLSITVPFLRDLRSNVREFASTVQGMQELKDSAMMDTVMAKRFVLMPEKYGTPKAKLELKQGLPHLTLADDGGRDRVNITVDADGVPQIVLTDANGVRRNAITVDSSGSPEISVHDGNGEPRIQLAISDGIPFVSVQDERGLARIAMVEVGLAIVDDEGKLRARLGVAPGDELAHLDFVDAQGRTIDRLPSAQ